MITSIMRIAVTGLFLSVVGTPAGAQAPAVKLTLDFTIQGQQSPFVLANEAGYFARAGVNVQVDRGYGSADAITKVASGAYDMAFADLGALIQFDGRQDKARLFSVLQIYDVAPMVVLSLKKAGISKPSDLAGKRVASPPASSTRVMFPLLAVANGLDPAAVSWIDVTPQLREMLLVQGQADATTALITDVPGIEHLGVADRDLDIMRFSDFGVALYGHCLLTTPEFAEKNPDTIKKVVKAVAESWKAAIADPDRAIAAIKKRDPLIDEKVERARFDVVVKNAILTDRVRHRGLGDVEPARMHQTVDMVAKTFNLPVLETSSVYRPDYLPPRADLQLQ
ncbi:MAG TPA: ABC transporter substrate-binding protein [Xanthobacteraceae bacterium]|jgi:NitT/TauT family transport system substrate-binding protein